MEQGEFTGSNEFKDRKERLSDEELGNLLAAIGNSEAKALTLILMQTGEVYSANRLHARINGLQGSSLGWKMSLMTPFGYCQNSLAPIGLVAEEVLNPDLSTFGYIRTKYGEQTGLPFAGLLLSFSEKHPEVSLYNLFGKTNSSAKNKNIIAQSGEVLEYKTRAPFLRWQILQFLAEAPKFPVKQADIVDKFSVGSARTKESLEELARSGIISYKGVGGDKPFAYYNVLDKINSSGGAFIRKREFNQSVLEALKERKNATITAGDVAILMIQKNSGWDKFNREQFVGRVNEAMIRLAHQGFLERGKYGKHKKSEIFLDDNQKAPVRDLVVLISSFQNQDSDVLDFGKKVATEIVVNPQRFARLMEKAKESSRTYAQVSMGEAIGQILSVLSTNPGSTNRDIRVYLEQQYGRIISRKRIVQLLKEMEKKGQATPKVRGGTKYWS